MTSSQFTGSGTDDQLRTKLEEMANALAARTTMPFAVPVKEILKVVYDFFENVPRVPNYDADLAWNEQPSASNAIQMSLTELPDAMMCARAYYNPDKRLITLAIEDGESTQEIHLEPRIAQAFFLHGLSAVAHAERQ